LKFKHFFPNVEGVVDDFHNGQKCNFENETPILKDYKKRWRRKSCGIYAS